MESKNRQDEFKRGLDRDDARSQRKEHALTTRRLKREQKLGKRRHCNYRVGTGGEREHDQGDPLACAAVSTEELVNLINQLDADAIVHKTDNLVAQLAAYAKIMYAFDAYYDFEDTLLTLKEKGSAFAPGAISRFLQSQQAVVQSLVELVNCEQTAENEAVQTSALFILKEFTCRRGGEWCTQLFDLRVLPPLLNHLHFTENERTKNYCLLIVGNMVMSNVDVRQVLVEDIPDQFLEVVGGCLDQLPHNVLWLLQTLYHHNPVPGLDFTKHVWSTIRSVILTPKLEENLKREVVDYIGSALALICECVKSGNNDRFIDYIHLVCTDGDLMNKLVYYVQHQNTPLSLCALAIQILSFLPKSPPDRLYLVQRDYLSVMCNLFVHSARVVRMQATFAVSLFSTLPDYMVYLCQSTVLQALFTGATYMNQEAQFYCVTTLYAMVGLLVHRQMEPELDQLCSYRINDPSGQPTVNVVHCLAVLFQDVTYYQNSAHLVRNLDNLISFLKAPKYKQFVLNSLEEKEAETQIQLLYDKCPLNEVFPRYEHLLDLLNGAEEMVEEEERGRFLIETRNTAFHF